MTTQSAGIKEFAIKHIGHSYVYGAVGVRCTPAYRRLRQAQYPQFAAQIARNCPVLSGRQSVCFGCKYNGKKAFDCAQLTRRSAEYAGYPPGTLPSGARSQFKKVRWAIKKKVADLQGSEGVGFLYKVKPDGSVPHTGVFTGNGRFVHARGHAHGVLEEPMSAYDWTFFCTLPGQDDEKTEQGEVQMYETIEIVAGRRLMRGADVLALQKALLSMGYDVGSAGADGIYGKRTEAAIKAYQTTSGLEVNGIVDEKLYNAITQAESLQKRNVKVVIANLTAVEASEIKRKYPQAVIEM